MGWLAHRTSKDITNAVNSYWRNKSYFLKNSRINHKLSNLNSCLCELLLVLDTRVSFASIYDIPMADLFDASKRMWAGNEKLNHATFEIKTDIAMGADPEFYQVLKDVSQMQLELARYLRLIAIESKHKRQEPLDTICKFHESEKLLKEKIVICQSLIDHRVRNNCSLM